MLITPILVFKFVPAIFYAFGIFSLLVFFLNIIKKKFVPFCLKFMAETSGKTRKEIEEAFENKPDENKHYNNMNKMPIQ